MSKIKKKFLVSLIFYIFMSAEIVLCRTKFEVSKLNVCPPQDSKFLTLVERSVEQCVEECKRRTSCKVLGYKRVLRLCELHGNTQSIPVDDHHCIMINKEDMNGPQPKCNCDEWSVCDEETGKCTKNECPMLSNTVNGTFLGNRYHIGAKQIVKCNVGHFPTNKYQAKCLKAGNWDHNLQCQEYPGTEQKIQFPGQNFKLKFHTTKATYQNASDICHKERAHLVRINKWWKMLYIRNILDSCFHGKMDSVQLRRYWTDGRHKGGIWKYSTGQNVPMDKKYWNPEIYKRNSKGKCIRLHINLFAWMCEKSLRFICEF